MNLALVLAVPDGPSIRADARYARVALDAPDFDPIRSALADGRARGLFAFALHGHEHYWPPTLMASADPAVQAWLRRDGPATTEELPAALQSRWIDAATLPSRPLAPADVAAAAAEEVAAFVRVVGEPPRVVVPPTFVWTREVEAAWSARGVECVVTPGWRYVMRGRDGLPAGDQGPIVNGDRWADVVYLARSDYFEPARGRDAVHALRVLDRVVAEGRPCLLENHRDNFIGDPRTCEHSLQELDALYRQAVARYPDLRFMSSSELAVALRERPAEWVVPGLRARLPALWQRLRHSGRPWRLLRLVGAGALGSWLVEVRGSRASGRGA